MAGCAIHCAYVANKWALRAEIGSQPFYRTRPVFDFDSAALADAAPQTNYEYGGCATGSVAVLLGNGDGHFSTQATFATGFGSMFVAVGDFNGDGLPDLAVTNYADNTVSILLNAGSAILSNLFHAQVAYPVGVNPQGVALGDFDHDGSLDLAVSNFTDGTISILTGVGNGTFNPQSVVSLPNGVTPFWLTAGDLRNNGMVDLVVPDVKSPNVYVLLNDGRGGFLAAVPYGVSGNPEGVSLGDMNGDGVLGLVVPDLPQDGLVSVLLGAGNGTFGAKTDYTVGDNPDWAALADFNGDGLLDIATSNTTGQQGPSVTVVLQARTQIATALGVTVYPDGVHTVEADYDGDSSRTGSISASTVSLNGLAPVATTTALTAAPNPGFTASPVVLTATVTPTPAGVPLGTVDFLDGLTPLGTVTINASGIAVLSTTSLTLGAHSLTAVYSGNPGFFTSTSPVVNETIFSPSGTATSLALSSPSVVAGTAVTLTATVTEPGSAPVSPGTVLFCDADFARCAGAAIFGTAQLQANGTASLKLTLGVGQYSIAAVFQSTNTDLSSVSAPQALTVTGNGGYATTTTIAVSGSVGNYTLAGTVAAFGNSALGGNVSFLDTSFGNVAVATAGLDPASLLYGFVQASGSPLAADANASNLVTGDFNNDGILDFAVVNQIPKDPSVSVYIGLGGGLFAAAVDYEIQASGSDIKAGDFNGDGKLDLVTANIGATSVNVLLGVGDGTFQAAVTYPVGADPASVTVGDFNHDGIQDLAVANSGDGTIGVLLGNPDGTFQPQVTYAAGASPSSIATTDVNGDGILDLATVNAADSTISVWLGYGDGTFQPQVTNPTGNHPVYILAGDVDNDGRPDLVVANRNDNTIGVFLGNGDGTFQAQKTSSTGANPIGLVAGDFNQDGKLDLAVTTGTGSVKILFGDALGNFGGTQVMVNSSGNVGIAIGDFNGDGLPDLVATNQSNQSSTISVLLNQQIETATATGVAVYPDGTHNVLASYPGDASRSASQSTTVALDGTPQTPTTTVLTAAPSPANLGQAVLLTATITPAPTGAPLGSVDFFDGATLLGNGTVTSGAATFSTSSLLAGVHNLTAAYSGNTAFAASTSAIFPETILATTSTALTAAPSPAFVGQTVTLTATVSPAPTGSSLGTVSFFNGATPLGNGSVNSSGVATFSTTGLPVGDNSLTAVYSGNTDLAGSTSIPFTETIVALTTTHTVLVAAPNPAFAGQTVALTATVSPSPTGTQLGTVSFFDGATLLATANVNSSGVATFSTSSLNVGTRSLTAVYSGNTGFAGSTSVPFTEVISPRVTTTTTLTVAPSPGVVGQTVTLTATISPAPTGTPLGTVTFFDGETQIGTGTVNSSGVATFSTTSLALGTHPLFAFYGGNPGSTSSNSNTFNETITNLPATTTVLVAAPNPAFVGQTVTLTATVSPAPTGGSLGTVSFFDGATLLATANVNSSGVAIFSTSSLSVGTKSLTAVYSGNAGLGGSTSTAFSETISPRVTTTTALIAAPSPAIVGQGVTLTATISPAPTGTPLGTVTFFDGETLLGTGSVNASGVATFSTATLALGSHPLTASFSGSTSSASSDSNTFNETISLPTTATTLTASPNPAVVGQLITLTATISPHPTGSSLGTVSFFDGATSLGSGNVNSSGVATLSSAALTVGSHSLTAVYSGNAGLAGSTSDPVTQIIAPLTVTTTVLTADPSPVDAGQSLTLTATIAPAPTGSSLGTVSFFAGSTLLGMRTVSSSGVATFAITEVTSGTVTFTAVYSGNSIFATSSSSPLSITVDPGFTVTAPPTPVIMAQGGAVDVNVTVPPLGGAFDQPVTLSATGLPNGATATFNPATVTPGASGAPTVMTIQLAKLAAAVFGKERRTPAVHFILASFFMAACCLTGIRRKRWPNQSRVIAFFAVLGFGAITTVGCGGGFLGPPTTHPGQYVVTITGTSGSVHASTTVTVVVQ